MPFKTDLVSDEACDKVGCIEAERKYQYLRPWHPHIENSVSAGAFRPRRKRFLWWCRKDERSLPFRQERRKRRTEPKINEPCRTNRKRPAIMWEKSSGARKPRNGRGDESLSHRRVPAGALFPCALNGKSNHKIKLYYIVRSTVPSLVIPHEIL